MSTINLQGATSGTIALVPTAIAGSNTITLPAETGTARTTVSSGTVLQVVNYQTGALATGGTAIPQDNTIPQITEGNEYMTLAITPRSATSKLRIDVVWQGANSAAPGPTSNFVTALFQDATANALASEMVSQLATSAILFASFTHYMTSGTTSSTTFRVRAGSGTAGTTTFNGQIAARFYGGSLASSITITEVVP